MSDLAIQTTPIPGLLVVDLLVHGDSRGWFKENWQRAKMVALGLPDFRPVQQNMSFNAEAGVTRGLHAEPWDKLIGLAKGRIFGAWVDLRPGETFGTSFTLEMGPEKAVFVPRGVANGYQALEPDTAYSYLVNEHWSPQARASYTYLNLADETVGIGWPIPLSEAILSDADLAHPRLAAVAPMHLVDVAAGNRMTLVQVSSDYVFDGVVEMHAEDEPFSPLSVYGATKAAGDSVVMTPSDCYVVRTSWVMSTGDW